MYSGPKEYASKSIRRIQDFGQQIRRRLFLAGFVSRKCMKKQTTAVTSTTECLMLSDFLYSRMECRIMA